MVREYLKQINYHAIMKIILKQVTPYKIDTKLPHIRHKMHRGMLKNASLKDVPDYLQERLKIKTDPPLTIGY